MENPLFRCLTVIASVLLFSLATAHAQAWKSIPAKDIPALKASAEKGDPAAKAEYAYHSLICLGDVPYDQNLIFRYFKESAEKGNVDGVAGLSHCYQFSIGTVMDREKAGTLAERARKAGHPIGTKIVASLAVTAGNFGGDRDWDMWVKLCKESAATGCTSARYNMALIYIDGIDGVPDLEEGVRRLRELHDAHSFPVATSWLLNYLGRLPIEERDSDLYRECYDLTHHYADLGEPEALYTLGRCHQRAGDEQTALAYFFEAAHRGSGKSWELLCYFRNEYDASIGFRSTLRDENNLSKRAYETGSRSPRIVVEAAEEYMRHFNRPEVQALMPVLQRDLLAALATGECKAHNRLGELYERANPKLNPDLYRPDLAAAHLAYHTGHGTFALCRLAANLAFPLYDGKASEEDLARALVAAEKARKLKQSDWTNKNWWELLQKKMTPAIRARAKELKVDGYPDSQKYRQEAAEILMKVGELPEKAIRD